MVPIRAFSSPVKNRNMQGMTKNFGEVIKYKKKASFLELKVSNPINQIVFLGDNFAERQDFLLKMKYFIATKHYSNIVASEDPGGNHNLSRNK